METWQSCSCLVIHEIYYWIDEKKSDHGIIQKKLRKNTQLIVSYHKYIIEDFAIHSTIKLYKHFMGILFAHLHSQFWLLFLLYREQLAWNANVIRVCSGDIV